MAVTSDTAVIPVEPERSDGRRLIRGSSLLMAGRILALGLNFVVHVLIVRYLSETSYGAFAYALSLVTFGETVVTLGFDRAVTRFIPIYDERQDYARVFGTLALVLGTVLSLGAGLLLLFAAFRGFVSDVLITDRETQTLMAIMIVLAPIQALDTVFNGLLTVFSSPRAIFLRKYVAGPCLRLLVVGLLVLTASDVVMLAVGYLIAGASIVLVFGFLLARILASQDYFRHFDFRTMRVPYREVLGYTVPLLASDLLYVVMNTADAVMLERFSGTAAVAAFRAVLPMARLNQLVLASFALLYTPALARLFARGDEAGINDLYWQNAAWTAIVSFPIFALSFSLAVPVTTFLLDDRYADSAIIMALLSLGFYFDAALGHNGVTLKVLGKTRYIVAVYGCVAVLSVVLNLILIPPFGALGAAIGTTVALVVFNVLKQLGLLLGTSISTFDARYRRVYLIISVAAVALLMVQLVLRPPFAASLMLAAFASLAVLRLNRRILDVEKTFPEVLRIPGLRWVLVK